jgi:hypothetical protein
MGYEFFRYARRIDADTIGIYHNDMTKMLAIDKATANTIVLTGLDVAAKFLTIKSTGANTHPTITLQGAGDIWLNYPAGKKVIIKKGITDVATLFDGGDMLGGVLGIKETTTPGAVANWGAIYTKADNELYFQTGAGVEKTVTTV